jgi:antitoxin HicB
MLAYPVKLTRDDGRYLVTFPDIPEAITQGDTVEEALAMAKDALETALDFYFDDKRPVPMPSKAGRYSVALPLSVEAKVLLLNEMVYQKIRPAELARRLNISPQALNRIVNLKYTTKIDTIAGAMAALGKKVMIKVA